MKIKYWLAIQAGILQSSIRVRSDDMGRLILVMLALAVCFEIGACSKTTSPDDNDRREQIPSDEAFRSSAADLYGKWAAGQFRRVSSKSIRANINRHIQVIDSVGLSTDSMESLLRTLAMFLAAYSSTDFDKYLAFRDPVTMAESDHPQLREKIDAISRGWASDAGHLAPTDAIGVMRFVWHMYIEGGMPGIGGGPVIEKVKWSSCRLRTNRLLAKEIQSDEWDQVSTTQSHFSLRLKDSPLGLVPFVEIEIAVPNRMSATEIATRDGTISYADFEIVIKTAEVPPHPLIVRLFYDPMEKRWLPLNAAKVLNNPPHMFVW